MRRCSIIALSLTVAILACLPALTSAQGIEQVTFEEAVRRAIANNPTIQQAAAGVLRAEALLQQVRSRSLPSVEATVTTSVIHPVTQFGGTSIFPRTQAVTSGGISMPLLTPVSWAERNQAADQVLVSQRTADDARREIAVAAGEAYLAVIARRRVLELNERARDNARAHFEYANQRFEGGIGSRLNALRAQQELSSIETRVEEAGLAVRRAQEALGVVMAAAGPIDASADPTFELPGEGDDLSRRSDIRLLIQRQSAAERVAGDAWKDNLPSVTALFAPQVLTPAGLFADATSWRGSVLFSIPLFDSGRRRGLAAERFALVDLVRAERAGVERRASSEVRTAREAVRSTERALEHARQAVEQATEVVKITDVAFREGATTNIEVIDAQRRARDVETEAAIAEDAVRRARLEVLVATGRFPQ